MTGPYSVCSLCLRGEHGDCYPDVCACRQCWGPPGDDADRQDDDE